MFDQLVKYISQKLDDNDQIGITYTYEASELNGDPAAVVIPSENDGDYITNQENIRIYAFNIRLYCKRTKDRKPEDAERILRNLVMSVIDDFDKDYMFTGISASTPDGYTFINAFAAPSAWGYSGREDEYRVAEINLRCRVSIDLNRIS